MQDVNVLNANQTAQLDFFEAPLAIPANRLDADQYSADDIDGVTESIFGSGNMAYASLQAAQTDAALTLNEALAIEPGSLPEQDGTTLTGNPVVFGNGDVSNAQHGPDREIPTDTDRALESGAGEGPEPLGAEGQFSNTTVGAIGASTLSSDAGSFAASSGFSAGGDSLADNSTGGNTSTTVVNNSNTTNIVNVDVDDTVQNIVNTVHETINNITNLGDELIDNVINLGDDIITTILEGDITEITEILTNEVTQITEILNSEINTVLETVNNFLEETNITQTLTEVTNITNEVTETVTTIINNVLDDVLGGGLALHLDTGVLETLGAGLHVTVDDSIVGTLGTGLVSDNMAGIVGDLTGLDVSLLPDTGLEIGFDLLGGSDPDDGADLSIAGLDTPDISLDLIEDIVGDVDIAVDLPLELTDPEVMLEGAGSLVESLDDIALAEPDAILDILGGQGADGALEIIAGDTVLGEDFDVELDSVLEDITTDIDGGGLIEQIVETAEDVLADAGSEITELLGDDLNIDDSIDLLSTVEGDGIGDLLGGATDETSWTDSTIDAGGLFDDVVSGIGGESDALPDPGGTVAEGLGVLNVEPEIVSGGLGGLFG